MTNSFFNFIESPDFASAIEETYKSVNTSYDRREQLEQENDKTRIKNAEMPLKMIEALAELAPKLKKVADDRANQKYLEDSVKNIPWKNKEDYDLYSNTLTQLNSAEALNQSIKGEAFAAGDINTLNMLVNDDVSKYTARNILFEQSRLKFSSSWNEYKTTNFPGGFEDTTEANRAFLEWRAQIKKNHISAGFNDRFFELRGAETLQELQKNTLTNANSAELTNLTNDEHYKQVDLLKNVVNNEDPFTAFYGWLDTNKGLHQGNQGQTARYGLQLLVKGVELKQIPASTVEAILNSVVEAKGDQAKLLIEKLGGSVEADVFLDGIVNSLEVAKKEEVQAIADKNSTYKTGYFQKMNEFFGDDLPTKEELADYIYTNPETKFDFSKGNLPEDVKKKLSAEAGADAEHMPLVYKKASLGILELKDVMKINDPFTRTQFMSQLNTQGGGSGGSGGITSLATSTARTIANTYTNETDGNKDKTIKWTNVNDQIKLHYPSVYAKHYAIAKAEPATETTLGRSREMVAQGQAQEELLKRAKDGEFDTWGTGPTRELALLSAVEHIKTGEDTNQFLDTEIIVGTEDALAEARKYPKGSLKVADLYQQIGTRLGIPGKVVQDKQLYAASVLEGKGLPALSDITVAYNELTDEQKTLVGKHPTPAKVARAKFLAFMQTAEGEEEGTITWDELLTVHPEVGEFLEKEYFGESLTTPELGKLEPNKGDWKELPGAFRVGYAVYDGKEWKYSQSKGKGNEEYFGNVTEYKDKDGFFYNFEGTKNSLNPLVGPEEPINTAEEGGPRVGDWYKVTNKMKLDPLFGKLNVNTPFVVWNGKEWIPSQIKGRFPQEFDGDKPLSQIEEEEALIRKQAGR